jgi:ectoine hydroxylase-related dioxygenase (phytanoyl-CoA dioxygenase family)
MSAAQAAVRGRELPPLESNGVALDMSPARLGWLVPSDPREGMDVLRERYRRDGYLWLKGLLDRDEVLAFRRRFFAAMAGTGLLEPGTDPGEGIYAGGGEDSRAVGRVLVEIVRWAAYEAFCLSAPVVRFYEAFFGAPPFLHKRKLLRLGRPGDPRCTGAHYDLVYLRGGTQRLCTSWIPIGDTPVEMGGLVYLEGSDAFGRELEARYAREAAHLTPEERIRAVNAVMTSGWLTKDLRSLAEAMGGRWLVADYQAGDMVVHSPFLIHASTKNVDPGRRIRLSTDIRYQSVRDEIDPRWQDHWSPDDGL